MRENRHNFPSIKVFSEILNQLNNIQDIEVYRYYTIVGSYLSGNKGYFALDELIAILRDKLKQKSLNTTSNINKFKKQLYKKLFQSTLFFQHIEKEKFKIISYRKILNNLGTSKHLSSYQHFPTDFNNPQTLQKKNFLDIVIGSYLLFNKEISNNQVAKKFSLTIMRVQQATRRNDLSGIIKKNFRLIKTECIDQKDAMHKRKQLWDLKISSVVEKKGKKFYICCYRTNSYSSTLPSHIIGRVRESAGIDVEKRYSIIPTNSYCFLSPNGKKLNVNVYDYSDTNVIDYKFYNKNWDLNNYVQEYGNFNF